MGYLIKKFDEVPGRRVLLVVSDGSDRGSGTRWDDLRAFAQHNGVAVFGYSTLNLRNSSSSVGTATTRIRPSGTMPSGNSTDDPFSAICQFTGGMVLSANDRTTQKDLARFVSIVRERYILEFARARNDSPGQHGILVTIDKNPTANIRPAGVIITMRDAAIDADPSTIPRDATNAPELGKRKPLH